MRTRFVRRPRAPRGRDVGWEQASFVSLDFETTGLDRVRDHVVSYGVVPVEHGRVLVGASTHRLVRPPIDPSPRSQTIHLLRPQDLSAAPTMEDAAADLRARIDRRYLLAWFAEVEVSFLRAIFGGSERWWWRRTIDVRDLAIAVDRRPAGTRAERGYALGPVADRYGVPVADPHDALDDALVTAQLFLVLVDRLPGLTHPRLRDLLHLSGRA